MLRSLLQSVLLWLLRAYRAVLSPLFGNVCRFEPSCSRYATECVQRFGPFKGSWLTVKRLARCQPFCAGGYDPPPPADASGLPPANAPHGCACDTDHAPHA